MEPCWAASTRFQNLAVRRVACFARYAHCERRTLVDRSAADLVAAHFVEQVRFASERRLIDQGMLAQQFAVEWQDFTMANRVSAYARSARARMPSSILRSITKCGISMSAV